MFVSVTDHHIKVFMFHIDGGHIYRSKRVPTLQHKGKPSPFKIMPVNEKNEIVQPSSEISTHADYIQELASWGQVVIQCEKGKFLTCSNFIMPRRNTQAWYSGQIGKSSMFEVEHCSKTGTFSFKSHNGFYLHYNNTLGTLVFKLKKPIEASWYVHPLNVAVSDTEKILVVAVVNKENEFLLLHDAGGAVKDWKIGMNEILDTLFNSLKMLPEGSCSMFQHPITLHQWCVTRSSEETLNLVISTELFPKTITSECVEELEDIFRQYRNPSKELRLQQSGIDKEDHFVKLLTALIFAYNDQYTYSSFATVHEEIRDAMEKMATNIEKMQENILNTEELKRTTDELLEFASKFERHSSKLKLHVLRKSAILTGVLIGGASGAVVGFLIGGPGGAAILGIEAAEIAAGLCIGMFLGSSAAITYTSRFWKRRFISFGKKMPLSSQ